MGPHAVRVDFRVMNLRLPTCCQRFFDGRNVDVDRVDELSGVATSEDDCDRDSCAAHGAEHEAVAFP